MSNDQKTSIPTTFMQNARAKMKASTDNSETQPVTSDEVTAKRLIKQVAAAATVVVGASLALTYILKRAEASMISVTPEDDQTED